MRFSTKSRYALRLMEELAQRNSDCCVSIKEISESQNISLKYLEQIVTPLARAGLVAGERGSHGGYRLTRPPEEYTAGEIIRAIEGPTVPVPCMEDMKNTSRPPAGNTPGADGVEAIKDKLKKAEEAGDAIQIAHLTRKLAEASAANET